MACAARCNPPRSVLRFPPQRTAISSTAYRNLLRSIQQSSTQHTAIFTQRTAILYIAYCNSFTQRTEILHIAYRNLPHSVPQFFTRHTAILHIACCNPPRSIQQFPPQLPEISVCSLLMAIQSLLMAIQRLRMYIQRLQTEILAIILIHFFRVLGRVKKAARGDIEYTLHTDIDVLGRVKKAARGVFLRFFLLFIRLCGGL